MVLFMDYITKMYFYSIGIGVTSGEAWLLNVYYNQCNKINCDLHLVIGLRSIRESSFVADFQIASITLVLLIWR
jgi:hypothetical protein